MLKLYYARPSLFARPVWLTLLEKRIPFELIPVNLGGEQFEPEFMAINPFSHIPVLIDGDFRVIESLAILDYLEAKFPDPPLLPSDPRSLASVRMVQMTTLNELIPAIVKLIIHDLHQLSDDAEYARLRAINALKFFEQQLRNSIYFAGAQITMADIVAGTLVHTLPDLGIFLDDFPRLQNWSDRLLARSTWQEIQLSTEEWKSFKRHLRVMPKIWERRRRKRISALGSPPC